MTPEDLQNELDAPLIGDVGRIPEERHSSTPNSNESTYSSQMANASPDTSVNETATIPTDSSMPNITNLNRNSYHCHHHLCHDGNSHPIQQRNNRSRLIVNTSETTRVDEAEQNIYSNHPDDQSDSDVSPDVPKLPNRPQMKLPCRNHCTFHEHGNALNRHNRINHNNA